MNDNRFSNSFGADRHPGACSPAGGGPAALPRRLQAQPRRQVSDLRVRRARAGAVLGLWRHSEPRAGRVLRPRRLLHGDVPQARSLERREHQDPVDARHSRLHGLESDHCAAVVLAAVPQPHLHHRGHHSGAGPVCPDHRRRDVQAPRRRHLFRHHHPGDGGDPDHPDRRPAGLHRRHQRHHRPADAAGLGHPSPTTPRSFSTSSRSACCSSAS